ncbi:MAG: rRNA maturation RNase YbeY [Patescibacteria group bacterium]
MFRNNKGNVEASLHRLPPLVMRKTSALVKRILQQETPRCTWNISIAAVTGKRMSELHNIYLHRRGTTDGLSFCLQKPSKNAGGIGEIIVDINCIRAQARARKAAFTQEFLRVIAHSCLHLVGYDHGTMREMKEMEKKEKKYTRI